MNVDGLEKLFKKGMSENFIYTKVPRGLIISIDENFFFYDCKSEIKESSLYLLDKFADILNEIPNYCVIENHSKDKLCSENLESWELSSMRSANIAEYLIKYRDVPPQKIFDIGFGETMPFKDNVSATDKKLDNRIDFVLIEYEAKR